MLTKVCCRCVWGSEILLPVGRTCVKLVDCYRLHGLLLHWSNKLSSLWHSLLQSTHIHTPKQVMSVISQAIFISLECGKCKMCGDMEKELLNEHYVPLIALFPHFITSIYGCAIMSVADGYGKWEKGMYERILRYDWKISPNVRHANVQLLQYKKIYFLSIW